MLGALKKLFKRISEALSGAIKLFSSIFKQTSRDRQQKEDNKTRISASFNEEQKQRLGALLNTLNRSIEEVRKDPESLQGTTSSLEAAVIKEDDPAVRSAFVLQFAALTTLSPKALQIMSALDERIQAKQEAKNLSTEFLEHHKNNSTVPNHFNDKQRQDLETLITQFSNCIESSCARLPEEDPMWNVIFSYEETITLEYIMSFELSDLPRNTLVKLNSVSKRGTPAATLLFSQCIESFCAGLRGEDPTWSAILLQAKILALQSPPSTSTKLRFDGLLVSTCTELTGFDDPTYTEPDFNDILLSAYAVVLEFSSRVNKFIELHPKARQAMDKIMTLSRAHTRKDVETDNPMLVIFCSDLPRDKLQELQEKNAAISELPPCITKLCPEVRQSVDEVEKVGADANIIADASFTKQSEPNPALLSEFSSKLNFRATEKTI